MYMHAAFQPEPLTDQRRACGRLICADAPGASNIERQLDVRLRQLTRFFYALKDPLRLRILVALAQTGEMTVTELVAAVRVSQPLVSWHLGRLRVAGLVQVKRDGRVARYSLDLEALESQYADFRALLTEEAAETHERDGL